MQPGGGPPTSLVRKFRALHFVFLGFDKRTRKAAVIPGPVQVSEPEIITFRAGVYISLQVTEIMKKDAGGIVIVGGGLCHSGE
jgi:hypothetical protein